MRVDVSVATDVQRLFQTVAEQFGRIDILVNNAAIRGGTSLAETEEANWDRVMDVNLKGAYLCLREAVRHMLLQNVINEARGRIVNISSQHDMVAAPHNFTYGVSKADPAIDPALLEYSRQRTPMPRLGTPVDVARAALFLASDDATYITGHNLMVDGGWMAH